jgi:hypothetical protein
VAVEPGTFDLRTLAESSAAHLAPYYRRAWLGSRQLERWLLDADIAEPNGAPGRWQLTERGRELVAAVAFLQG